MVKKFLKLILWSKEISNEPVGNKYRPCKNKVIPVGWNEKVIREYIKAQEAEDRRLAQLSMFKY